MVTARGSCSWARIVEGSSADTNSTVGTGTMAGANQFSFTFVVPSSITPGMSVTAISGGTADCPRGFPVRRRFADHRRIGRADDQQRRQRARFSSARPSHTRAFSATTPARRSRERPITTTGPATRLSRSRPRPSRPPVTTNTPRWRRARTSLSHIFTAPGTYDVSFRSSTAIATRPRVA